MNIPSGSQHFFTNKLTYKLFHNLTVTSSTFSLAFLPPANDNSLKLHILKEYSPNDSSSDLHPILKTSQKAGLKRWG